MISEPSTSPRPCVAPQLDVAEDGLLSPSPPQPELLFAVTGSLVGDRYEQSNPEHEVSLMLLE